MFSVSANKGLNFIWKFAWRLGAVPYYPFTTKSGQLSLSLSQSKSRTRIVKFATIIFGLYIGFITFKFYDGLTSDKIPPKLRTKFKVKMMYLLLVYGYPGIVQINEWKKWHEIPVFLRNFLNFFKIGNKERQENSQSPVTKYIATPFLIGFGVTLLNILVIIIKPESPQMLTSLLNNPKNGSALKKLPCYLVHMWIWPYSWVC